MADEVFPLYQFGKDYGLPLLSLSVAIAIPTVLTLVQAAYNRKKLAIEFFNAFFSEEMRKSRREGYTYMVTERKKLPEPEQTQRLEEYVTLSTTQTNHYITDPTVFARFQELSRVLQFYHLVDVCVRQKTVDRTMIRSFLSWYYLWWHDEIILPIRSRHLARSGDLKVDPPWLVEFSALDALCRPESRR